MTRGRRIDGRECRNPRCREVLTVWTGGVSGLCPSCRLAGRWGIYAAFAAMFLWKLATWWFA